MSRQSIGFTQRIQLEWLEWTAQMALADFSEDEIYAELQNRLRPIVSVGGHDNRSNRGKVVGILLKIWVKTADELRPFRDEGLEFLAQSSPSNHLPLHWGMSMATYPFFGTVVNAVGRLIHLQNSVTLAQVSRRVQEKYGQRESIHRATQRVFYCLHDWGVLAKTDERMVYTGVKLIAISSHRLSSWLIEAGMIAANAQSTPLDSALQMPVLFPFSLTTPRVTQNQRLELFRQGLDNDFILRTEAPVG
ncbi:MAG TPA: hypothetical protein EYH05_10025 [Anaerolineae bacterium]|nr:hypothetical protein [Anaerolineae bacterium]